MKKTTMIFVASLVICNSAIAVPILDQSNFGPRAGGFLVGQSSGVGVQWLAQSFTSSMDGLLASFQLDLNTNHPNTSGTMNISLRETLYGLDLASFTHTNTSVDGFFTFDTSDLSIFTAIEKEFFIVASSDSESFGTWWGNGNGTSTYSGGMAYSGLDGILTARPDMDMLFTTYVDPEIQAVPEPTTLPLLLLGLVGLIGFKKFKC